MMSPVFRTSITFILTVSLALLFSFLTNHHSVYLYQWCSQHPSKFYHTRFSKLLAIWIYHHRSILAYDHHLLKTPIFLNHTLNSHVFSSFRRFSMSLVRDVRAVFSFFSSLVRAGGLTNRFGSAGSVPLVHRWSRANSCRM